MDNEARKLPFRLSMNLNYLTNNNLDLTGFYYRRYYTDLCDEVDFWKSLGFEISFNFKDYVILECDGEITIICLETENTFYNRLIEDK